MTDRISVKETARPLGYHPSPFFEGYVLVSLRERSRHHIGFRPYRAPPYPSQLDEC